MTTFTAVVQRDPDTNLYVGYVPGFPGAHSQAESLDELQANLREVITLLLEGGSPKLEAEFIGSSPCLSGWGFRKSGSEVHTSSSDIPTDV